MKQALISVVIALLITTASAQSGPTTVRVLVTSTKGQSPIAKDQVTARFDGQPAEIQGVAQAKGDPLVFAVLMDVSGSSIKNEQFERRAAVDLFRALAVPPNVAFFGDFNDEIYLSKKPATIEWVDHELKQIPKFRGGTALYDAVLSASELVAKHATGPNDRRAVFVITDGRDDASHISEDGIIKQVQRLGVSVFCIGLLPDNNPGRSEAVLEKLSQSTGGVAHLYDRPKDFLPELLPEVENQYWLTVLVTAAPDKKLHQLTIKSTDKHVGIAAPAAVAIR